ncbi:MAG: tetratricopeptide repeat protein [Parafilimonas sp.]
MKGEKNYSKAKALHEKMYAYPNDMSEHNRVSLYKQYMYFLKRSAYLGNVEAQYDLGQQYETMNYLSIQSSMYNPKKCVYWYTKACLQNHAAACNNLASFYESGEGCKKNLQKAMLLYKKSGELGYTLGKKNYLIMRKQIQS